MNITRTALHRGIPNPRELPVEQMKEGLRYTKERKRLLQETHKGLQQVHMRECLVREEAEENLTKVKGIKAKIEREGSKKMWYFINRPQKDPHMPAPHVVQRCVEGNIDDPEIKEEMEGFIFEER